MVVLTYPARISRSLRIGEDLFEGPSAHATHWRIALVVVPDGTHGLFEGPRLAPLPFEVFAAEVVTEQVSTFRVEEMPGSNEIKSRIGRAEAAHIEYTGEATL